jgi:two-component system, cell cycle response regulator
MRNNVLLIVHNEKELAALADKLQPAYNVYTARNGKEIQHIVECASIQLIICNEEKPMIHGGGICETIKSSFHYAHIPVILLTASNSSRSKIRILEAGVDAFVTKPVDWNYLHAQIKNLIYNRTKIAEHFGCSLAAARETVGATADNDFVKKLNDCIVDNMHKKVLSVDFLARSMNMSRPTLYRKIRSITDRTPNELIALARMKQAAALLVTADYKIFEVAKMVGFNSQSTFGKAFLKSFNVTPTTYQRIHKSS